MVDTKVLAFIEELKANNNREWFNANKERYLEAKVLFDTFINLLIQEISVFDKSVFGIEAKDCVFRIYRDVRFSPNKTPYKTHFGAYIARGGRKSNYAGYYIHIEPGSSMLGGGIFMPESKELKAIREEIYNNLEEFTEIVEAHQFKATFNTFFGEKLKTVPRNYPPDFEGIEWLRFKSYAVSKTIMDKDVQSAKFLIEAAKTFETLYPLNQFLNAILDENR